MKKFSSLISPNSARNSQSKRDAGMLLLDAVKSKPYEDESKSDFIAEILKQENKIDLTYRDEETGLLAIEIAASKGNTKTVRDILNFAKENSKKSEKSEMLVAKALRMALSSNKLATVSDILDHQKISPKILNDSSEGPTPLAIAAYNNNPEIVSKLIQMGAVVDLAQGDAMFGQTNVKGWTPLMLATFNNGVEATQALLENGAKSKLITPFLKDPAFRKKFANKFNSSAYRIISIDLLTPLTKAVRNGQIEVVNDLIAQGANVNELDFFYRNALSFATGDEQLFLTLIKNGADANLPSRWKDTRMLTPLMAMALSDKDSYIPILIEHGADVNLRNKAGKTALDLAKEAEALKPGSCKHSISTLSLFVETNQTKCTPLTRATYSNKGRPKFVELLSQGANINEVDGNGRTPLMMASYWNSYDIISDLLHLQADKNIFSPHGDNALAIAIKKNSFKSVVNLFKSSEVDAEVTKSGMTALSLACYEGKADIVKHLIQRGASVNKIDGSQLSPLMAASCRNHDDVMQILIQHGADVNLSNQSGDTALTLGASNGSNKAVSALLNCQGINIEATNNEGWTALGKAIHSNKTAVAKSLISSGADVNKLDPSGYHPFTKAAFRQNNEVMLALLDSKRVDVNLVDSKGYTPVTAAAVAQSVEMLNILISRGANINQPQPSDNYGYTALMLVSAKSDNKEAVKFLMERVDDVNATSSRNETALHISIRKDNLENALTLLTLPQIDVNLKNEAGFTPLDLARKSMEIAQSKNELTQNHLKIISILEQRSHSTSYVEITDEVYKAGAADLDLPEAMAEQIEDLQTLPEARVTQSNEFIPMASVIPEQEATPLVYAEEIVELENEVTKNQTSVTTLPDPSAPPMALSAVIEKQTSVTRPPEPSAPPMTLNAVVQNQILTTTALDLPNSPPPPPSQLAQNQTLLDLPIAPSSRIDLSRNTPGMTAQKASSSRSKPQAL